MSSKPWGALPIYRINTIMKSSSEVETIAKDSTLLMAKAAELFIQSLTKEGYKLANEQKLLDYKHVAEVVNGDEKYEFLRDIMPKKITFAEYKRLQGDKEGHDSSNSDESESDDSSTDQSQ